MLSMRTLLVIVQLFATANAVAQYSQWRYESGNPNSYEQLCNGSVLRCAAHQGHIMAGFIKHDSCDLYVVKNDLNGRSFEAPYFNNAYSFTNAAGVPLDVYESKVVELRTGIGYAVSGRLRDMGTGNPGIFYLLLDTNGDVLSPPVVYRTIPGAYVMRFGSVRENREGTALYLTGSLLSSSTDRMVIFVHKIDLAGDVVWSGTYSIGESISRDQMAYDALED
jgi:hypothetical protein